MNPPSPAPKLAIGLMSGTSADGIDIALVRIPARRALSSPPRLENFISLPYPRAVRDEILRLAGGAPASPRHVSQLNFRLGRIFGEAILKACRSFRVSPARISFIGSHGQTIFHQGAPAAFLGAKTASTLQIGEPALIAAITGIVTVADFRPADMALGGQGAPLLPWVDYLLYRHPRQGRAVLNIGGIANFTVIPPAAAPERVFAFDTGPGNMLLDGLIRHLTGGRRHFDADARFALRGQLLPSLLEMLLRDPFFELPPPKSAGREQFGQPYLKRILDWGRRNRARPENLAHTVAILTPVSIASAIHKWVLPRVPIHQVLVSGGGARNPLMMAQLAAALKNLEVIPTDRLGLPADAKEAFAFALLANETLHRRPANLPRATGASGPAILGKICYPPPRSSARHGA